MIVGIADIPSFNTSMLVFLLKIEVHSLTAVRLHACVNAAYIQVNMKVYIRMMMKSAGSRSKNRKSIQYFVWNDGRRHHSKCKSEKEWHLQSSV